MEAEAVLDALAETLAGIEAKNIFQDIAQYTDKGTF